MDIKTVKINENEIDYFSFGAGSRSFVIIPGLSLQSVMLSADAVAAAYSEFENDYTVYVFDRAKNIKAGYSVEDIAEDTVMAMSKLGIKDAYVFGASQGGMIAQAIAVNYPSLIKKLVIGSSACRMNNVSSNVLNEWVELSRLDDSQPLNHSVFTHLYTKELLDSLGESLQNLEKQGTSKDLKRFEILASACLNFDIYDQLGKIKCDTLVIGANNDMVLGGESSPEIAEKIGCELYIYDGGHAIYDEAPDYKKRIINYFDK